MGSYGVAAASLAYFDKSVNELEIQEAAYLARPAEGAGELQPVPRPGGGDRPSQLGHPAHGRERRDHAGRALAAIAKPLGVNPRPTGTYLASAEYFTEEVRRQVISRYGVKALYEGGLSVRSTLDPQMQVEARTSLQHALVQYDQTRGYRGPVETVELGGDWGPALNKIEPYADVPEWRLAVVLSADSNSASIGLQPSRDISGRRERSARSRR